LKNKKYFSIFTRLLQVLPPIPPKGRLRNLSQSRFSHPTGGSGRRPRRGKFVHIHCYYSLNLSPPWGVWGSKTGVRKREGGKKPVKEAGLGQKANEKSRPISEQLLS